MRASVRRSCGKSKNQGFALQACGEHIKNLGSTAVYTHTVKGVMALRIKISVHVRLFFAEKVPPYGPNSYLHGQNLKK